MSRGRHGFGRRGRRPGVGRSALREPRDPSRLNRIGLMVRDDPMERVMPRVLGRLLARSTLLTSVAAALVVLSCCSRCARASEFPERECCDLIFPIPEPTGKFTSAPTPTGRSGSDIKVPVAILNCLYARQLCFEDPSCNAILEIIPRVCGPELVACSTVTVTKCQAALHTLKAFSFFRPTCLCREPHVDPDCNSFQNFLFDHPCNNVLKEDKNPDPIDALPSCNHAMSVCLRGKPCSQIFEDFKSNCKAREGKCRMESRIACHDSWTQLRQSPLFGCICPNMHMKRRCDRIFSMVNHNPCVVKVIAHPDNSTSFEVIESQLENPLINADHQDLLAMQQIPVPGSHHHKPHHKKNQTDDRNQSSAVLPSASSDLEKIQQPVKVVLSSTCHHAYTACKNDPECKVLLEPVLNHCDSMSCARNDCMEALQNFYKSANHKHSVEIAFCLCRKTDGKKDECIVAQEKMHPACAQRNVGSETPTCHSLAKACKHNPACRMKLEYYEQSCAVDSVTKKCAGPPADCRKAMLGILGTELRSNCACKGTELAQLYDCLGWQRLLWVNPCVVESQKDYHARRKHHHYPRTTTTTVSSTTKSPVSTTTITVIEQVEDNQIPEVTRWSTTEPTETWEITATTTTTTTTTTVTTTTASTTTVSTTPSTTTTTTTPPRFCVVQRPRQSHQYIREGKGKRLYREDEPECSELCQCGEGEVLICNTICVDSSPCKTDFAFYNHEAPAYQAHRGPCLCYSGRFICMRPSPDAYSIPHGVFMFLGYSEKDESLLRQHNNLTVLDAVSSLDSFMREEVNNQTVCTLFLYNATRENVIAAARLGTDNPPLNSSQAQSLQHLLRVKEECASMLQDLSDKINNKHHEVHTHPLLSIFKMAEVEVKLPYSNEVGGLSRSASFLLVAILLLLNLVRSRSTCLVAS
ncbi:glial cell line-derived neurotrophic family receptor-like isoform X3 [Ptiloglossa arizonensis]|uniref:glial cell line-derived neurotrophic family receptor-like isoform X3 n=1 Tax=Ptiloglossa arizonensis TaxID=3350558 RepID=UPI003F9ECF94